MAEKKVKKTKPQIVNEEPSVKVDVVENKALDDDKKVAEDKEIVEEPSVKEVEKKITKEDIPVEETVKEEILEDKPLKKEETSNNINETNNNGIKTYKHYYNYVWNGICY